MELEQVVGLVGVVLVLFFAVLLLTSKRYKSYPNVFLAAALVVLAILIVRINIPLNSLFSTSLFDFLRIEYLFSGLLFLYVSTTLAKPPGRATYAFLLAPFLFFSGLYTLSGILEWVGNETGSAVIEIMEPIEVFTITIFNGIVIVLLFSVVQKSEAEDSFKKWISIVAGGLMSIMLGFLVLEFLEILLDLDLWSYLNIFISLFFIAIVYIGVQQLQVEKERKTIRKLVSTSSLDDSSVSTKTVSRRFEQMQQLMQEEDYVNAYRVGLAKELLKDKRFDLFSLEAIGREVGFKSRSTFYNTFKQMVGCSPGAFKKGG